jgi:hypothetical protein
MSGTTFNWTGSKDTDWTKPVNWQVGTLPATVAPNSGTAAVTDSILTPAVIPDPTSITVGSLSITGEGDVWVGGALTSLGLISVTSTNTSGALIGILGAPITAPAMTVGPGAVIGGGGTFDVKSLVNNGVIQADGGLNFLLGPVVVTGGTVSGSGNFEVDGPSTLEIGSTTAQNIIVNVATTETATLILDNPGSYTGSINLNNPNSKLDLFLGGQTPSGATYDGNTLTITGAGGAILDTILLKTNGPEHFAATTSSLGGFGEISIGPADPVLPGIPPPVNGISTTELSSEDLAQLLLGDQSSLRFVAGTEAIVLVDGTLSVGADTNEAFLTRLYDGILGRAPDANGLSSWDAMLTGTSKADVAQSFLDSGEYQAAHAGQTDVQFLNSLYTAMLGRPADQGGLNGWSANLAGGMSRGDVAAGFADSSEGKEHWSGATSNGVFAHDLNAAIVREYYHAAFGREADTGGLAAWINNLRNGETSSQMAQDLTASSEFQALHGQQSNLQYVDSLYANGLGRPADPGGETGWVNALESGASRSDLLLAFAQSPEGQHSLQWALT